MRAVALSVAPDPQLQAGVAIVAWTPAGRKIRQELDETSVVVRSYAPAQTYAGFAVDLVRAHLSAGDAAHDAVGHESPSEAQIPA